MRKILFSILVISLLFININVFANEEVDNIAHQIQNNVQQRIVIRNEEFNEYLNESINDLSELKASVSYTNLKDLKNDRHYPIEVLITGIISFIFIITMSLCIVLNNRKRKALR